MTLTGDVGIDVEYVDENRDVERLAMEYFSPGENEWLRGQSNNSFFMLWVLKEAWLILNIWHLSKCLLLRFIVLLQASWHW